MRLDVARRIAPSPSRGAKKQSVVTSEPRLLGRVKALRRTFRDGIIDVHAAWRALAALKQTRPSGGSGPAATRDAETGRMPPFEGNLREELTAHAWALDRILQHLEDELGRYEPFEPELPWGSSDEPARQDDIEDYLPPDLPAQAAMLRVQSSQMAWPHTVELQAGEWKVSLSGAADPAPRLAVKFEAPADREPSPEVLLTVVRRRHGFEVVALDSECRGEVPLSSGENVLLIQAAQVWELRLVMAEPS
jgi:hypothetical protein